MSHPVLIAGQWREADASGSFRAENPQTGNPIPGDYPVSRWSDCDEALDAATTAFYALREMPAEQIAQFLETYADRIEARSKEICELASQETALPVEPRFASGELPRTTNQLRQAAASCRSQEWKCPTIDTANNLRSCFGPIGPVVIFGPNNFPLAYNGISGGDFASAIAAGNPVIAKAHPLHPGTSRLLAEEAQEAAVACDMPPGTVQMLYNIDYADGEKMIADRRLGAVGFTGSRKGGLALKGVADSVGKPIYLEMSSINPIVILSGALAERADDIVDELTGSCLMGTGQFCTSPGIIVLPASDAADEFIASFSETMESAPVGTLLSRSGLENLAESVATLVEAGATKVVGGKKESGDGYRFANTVLRTDGEQFLANPELFQTEAFGNVTMIVTTSTNDEVCKIIQSLEGNLTGSIYSATDGRDDSDYDEIAPHLRQRVGRMLNDKMPTGVAVSPAMNHGGPYPATGHPVFTAVGFPASIVRFSMLQCYDHVRPDRLPPVLRDENPSQCPRRVDGQWTTDSIGRSE